MVRLVSNYWCDPVDRGDVGNFFLNVRYFFWNSSLNSQIRYVCPRNNGWASVIISRLEKLTRKKDFDQHFSANFRFIISQFLFNCTEHGTEHLVIQSTHQIDSTDNHFYCSITCIRPRPALFNRTKIPKSHDKHCYSPFTGFLLRFSLRFQSNLTHTQNSVFYPPLTCATPIERTSQ